MTRSPKPLLYPESLILYGVASRLYSLPCIIEYNPVSRFGSQGSGKGCPIGQELRFVRFRLQIFRDGVEKTMTNHEQENAFADDLEKLINRYLIEFDMTTAGIIGVLECIKLELWQDGWGGYSTLEPK